jgi:hypothetical protein
MNKIVLLLCLLMLGGCTQFQQPNAPTTTNMPAQRAQPAQAEPWSTSETLAVSGLVALTLGGVSTTFTDDFGGSNAEGYAFPLIMAGTGVVFLTSALVYYIAEDRHEDDEEDDKKE